jgi:hypothetical protein
MANSSLLAASFALQFLSVPGAMGDSKVFSTTQLSALS